MSWKKLAGRSPGRRWIFWSGRPNASRSFAEAQLKSVTRVQFEVPGGTAGHRLAPVRSVGAYAPGGRHPLPSSLLMTVIPARVAGVETVTVASPRPTPVTLASAQVAGADLLLSVGGAQAVAALAFGVGGPPCDIVVGPGNRWVTAAKKHLYGEIGIDGLAGPSEVIVVADHTSDPGLIASDLLAQAEHDPDARVGMIALDPTLPTRVDECLENQLRVLPTAETARLALDNAFSVVAMGITDAAEICDQLAPRTPLPTRRRTSEGGRELQLLRFALHRRDDHRGPRRLRDRTQPRPPYGRNGPVPVRAVAAHLPAVTDLAPRPRPLRHHH